MMESTIRIDSLNDIYATIDSWRQQLNQRILGQAHLIDQLLIAVLCDGHLLIEEAHQDLLKPKLYAN